MKRIGKLVGIMLVYMTFIASPVSQVKAQAEDESRLIALVSDPDWKLIQRNYVGMMDKLVQHPQLREVNLNNQPSFLAAVGMSQREYSRSVDEVKAAAKRLVDRYNLKGDCPTCHMDEGMVNTKLQDIALEFQQNPRYYQEHKTALLEVGAGELGGWCCRWKFYACCTVCAATIAAFPAYLACCAICFDTYCCKPT